MPIAALPQETIRLLGSPLVYSSPVAVVKELVDNAIDARATSVDVFISANCVDSIEVRDNGQGIHSDDFAALGHRGCTSKLRNFEDIQTVGGVTLGFRGDALASASTLSTLQIVTRTAGESTAAKLYLSANGGVAKIERVAAPVGTAVKVTDLFAKIPVRKQWALKEAAKTIPKIKHLLHSYAFAKPHVKLIFRVHEQLKAAWSYAPGSHPTIKQAALQVFGAELVSQCVEKTNRRVQDMTNSASDNLAAIFRVQVEGNYIIDALLPQPGADPTKISKGAWFSVDARPVSSSKGTIKILYSAFRACLSRTLASDGSTITLKNPFLAVNINCPPKSYDPNIEPSKDEVLFVNSHRLIEVFGRLLEDVYSTPPTSNHLYGDHGAQLATPSSHPASKVAIPQEHGPRLPSLRHTPVVSPPSPLISGSDASVSSWIPGLISTSQAGTQQLSTRPLSTVRKMTEELR
ncbi:hypothetical protein BR93DRAFT_939513 [Coniochaeta sp. PMI_546]|nr:hypothetical protein BR93DRAFT_939513 [Coniochaeta sp. PMI_546]